MRALLFAVVVSLAAPAALTAAESTPLVANPAATALDTNLLSNPSFEATPYPPIPGWTLAYGDAHVLTFGTRAWPSQVYANKWGGGHRYLECRQSSGAVTQTVNFTGYDTSQTPITARFNTYFGAETGHIIRVSLRMLNSSNVTLAYKEKLRVSPYANHYLNAVTTLGVPPGTTKIQGKIELIKMDGAGKCKVVADTAKLYIYRDG